MCCALVTPGFGEGLEGVGVLPTLASSFGVLGRGAEEEDAAAALSSAFPSRRALALRLRSSCSRSTVAVSLICPLPSMNSGWEWERCHLSPSSSLYCLLQSFLGHSNMVYEYTTGLGSLFTGGGGGGVASSLSSSSSGSVFSASSWSEPAFLFLFFASSTSSGRPFLLPESLAGLEGAGKLNSSSLLPFPPFPFFAFDERRFFRGSTCKRKGFSQYRTMWGEPALSS